MLNTKISKRGCGLALLLSSVFLCSCASGVNVVQKGWDKYAGNLKATLEQDLVLRYAHIEEEDLNTVFYYGKYGNYTGHRADATSFYFAYSVKEDFTYSISALTFETANSISTAKRGILINNA